MNKIYSMLFVVLALGVGITIGSTEASFAAWWNGADEGGKAVPASEVSTPEIRAIGGISDDVWQESCNPIIVLSTGASCQQANVIIQQQHKMIQLLEKFTGEE